MKNAENHCAASRNPELTHFRGQRCARPLDGRPRLQPQRCAAPLRAPSPPRAPAACSALDSRCCVSATEGQPSRTRCIEAAQRRPRPAGPAPTISTGAGGRPANPGLSRRQFELPRGTACPCGAMAPAGDCGTGGRTWVSMWCAVSDWRLAMVSRNSAKGAENQAFTWCAHLSLVSPASRAPATLGIRAQFGRNWASNRCSSAASSVL